jgi:hypothetical protein
MEMDLLSGAEDQLFHV